MIILRRKTFSFWEFCKKKEAASQKYPHNDGQFTVRELKSDKKALEKFLYEIESSYLPDYIDEREFIKSIRKMREDNDSIVFELDPHSRLITSGVYPKTFYWSFIKDGDVIEYETSGN